MTGTVRDKMASAPLLEVMKELVRQVSEVADAIQSLEETVLAVADIPASRPPKKEKKGG